MHAARKYPNLWAELSIEEDETLRRLRDLKIRAVTDFADSLATAIHWRNKPKPSAQPEQWDEVNSHGFTLAQTSKGRHRSAIKANRNSLLRYFTAALPALDEAKQWGLVNRAYAAMKDCEVPHERLKDAMKKANYIPRNSKGQTAEEVAEEAENRAEEERIAAAFTTNSRNGHRVLKRLTQPLNESHLGHDGKAITKHYE